MGGTFEEWAATLPAEITDDSLWRVKAYRLALFASDMAWNDVAVLRKDRRMSEIAGQMHRAVASISANLAEGYSRRGGQGSRTILRVFPRFCP